MLVQFDNVNFYNFKIFYNVELKFDEGIFCGRVKLTFSILVYMTQSEVTVEIILVY